MRTRRRDKKDEPDPVIRELARTAGFVAKRVIEAVLDGRPADRELGVRLRELGRGHPRDARFIARACFAAFRWWGWTGKIVEDDLPRGLLASYLLDSGPYHVVTTDWANRYKDIEGASLTPPPDDAKIAARADWLRTFLKKPKERLNPLALVPAWFFKLVPIPNRDFEHALLEILQRPVPLWIRFRDRAAADRAATTSLGFRLHGKLPLAAVVEDNADLYRLPAFQAGDFEIQDLASQAVGIACDPKPGERWWDACAGAGGKALQLASMMNAKGLVLASDIKEHKLDETRRRAARAKLHNLSCKPWDGRRLPAAEASFDGVLVDAPCTGVGTWRRNPDARWRTSESDVLELSELQKNILHRTAPGVRPGGRLVYAVCTLTKPETTDVVDAFLAAHPEFTLTATVNPITGAETDGRVWVWPTDADCDGMFVARLERRASPRS